MGCCSCKQSPSAEVNIEELSSVRSDIPHPFIEESVFKLYEIFKQLPDQVQIQKFEQVLRELNIPLSPFFDQEGYLQDFMEAVSINHNKIDGKLLKLSGILLGKEASFSKKLDLLIELYGQEKNIKENQIQELVSNAADLACKVQPKVSYKKLKQTKKHNKRLQEGKPYFIKNFMKNFRPKEYWDLKELKNQMRKNPRLKKVAFLDQLREEILETPNSSSVLEFQQQSLRSEKISKTISENPSGRILQSKTPQQNSFNTDKQIKNHLSFQPEDQSTNLLKHKTDIQYFPPNQLEIPNISSQKVLDSKELDQFQDSSIVSPQAEIQSPEIIEQNQKINTHSVRQSPEVIQKPVNLNRDAAVEHVRQALNQYQRPPSPVPPKETVINIALGPNRTAQLIIKPGEDPMNAGKIFAFKHKFTAKERIQFLKCVQNQINNNS